jgi:mono/diheme cytochrome c family protein
MMQVLKLVAFTLAVTAFYTYVGHMVPQAEVHPPKERVLSADMTTDAMVEAGQEIVQGKGTCMACHTMGASGNLRFPDLAGLGERAQQRRSGMSDVEYLAESLYDPGAYIVPGFNPGMPPVNKPPIGLSDDEIRCVVAYLQSLGGNPTVTMQTTFKFSGDASSAVGGNKP